MRIKHYFVLVFVLLTFQLSAQMIDDSTKVVYGPTTTRYRVIQDLKYVDTVYHHMDSSLTGLEKFEFVRSSEVKYFNLGNNGTALNPIYYTIPQVIGRSSGFEAYTPYVKSVEDFRYYDSKSPYTKLFLAMGGKGRSRVDFEFARNVNKNWNLGFDIYRIASNKQLGSSALRENQVLSSGLDLFTAYHTDNKKYHVLFHVLRFGHNVTETGGIVTTTLEKDYFLHQDAVINLRSATTKDVRSRFYVYQQYTIKPFLELYATVQHNTAVNQFNDFKLGLQTYYDRKLIRTDSTLDASEFKEWNVEAGLKGNVANRIFYSAHLKRRDLDFKYNYSNPYGHGVENYLGGDLRMLLTKTNEVGGDIEINDGGQFYLQGYYKNNFLMGSYTSSLYKPSYMVEQFFGNHYEWENSFNSTLSNSIKGALFYDFGFVRLQPEVEISTVNNYIYFDSLKSPKQIKGPILINKYSTSADFKLGHFRLDNQMIFNDLAGSGSSTMRVPKWNYYGRWYYTNIIFNHFMEMQLGFDIRYQSAFYGKAYDPITQQFYLQDNFQTKSFLVVDAFFVMKSNDLSFFVKLNYLNQKRGDGYFATPYYPGMRRVVDLGVRWMFFN